MGKGGRLPHDRGHLLWTPESGATNRLLASIDRWVSAMLADDGIEMPVMAPGPIASASIMARSDGVVAGTAAVDHLLQIWAPGVKVEWSAGDGRKTAANNPIGRLHGPAESLLAIERPVLNILGHLGGIATAATAWSKVAPGQIACTRKTVLGLLDKWAVHLGGGLTHRLDRQDALMLKENDLVSYDDDPVGQMQLALRDLEPSPEHAFVEVEARTPKQAIAAALAWATRKDSFPETPFVVMLDNMGPEVCREVSTELETLGHRRSVVLEASGGITLKSLPLWKDSGMDVLSTSAINRGVDPLDVSMLMDGA